MPGRRTSRSRHAVSGACCTCKNASADAKPCTRNPTDWSRSSSEFRSASSSSTTTMSGTLHIPLPRGERLKPAAQGCPLRPLRARVAVACERLVHSVEQVLVAEGFGEEFYRPGFHRLHAHRDIAVAGDENNGEGQVARRQPLLQLQPAETR